MFSTLTSLFTVYSSSRRDTAPVDLEAQSEMPIASTSTTTSTNGTPTALPTPPRAFAHDTHVQGSSTDPLDDFFGVTRTGTRDSRHDDTAFPAAPAEEEMPPPYMPASDPPAYTRFEEHPTLAKYLFIYGFLLPLFWIAGACILVSPLTAPEDWETSKTEEQRRELIEAMRRTEMKWARRCLTALTVLACIVVVVVLVAIFMLNH